MSCDIPKLRLSTSSPISKQVYGFLRSLIVTASIKPGTSFSENELSNHFKVSRQPIREALNHLEHDKLICVYPQKGTVVKKISVSNLKQVVFLRTALECACIDHIKDICVKDFSKIIKKLKNNIEDQRTKTDPNNVAKTFLPLDDKFHELICMFSDAPMTWNVIQSFKGQLDRIRYLSMGHESPVDKLIHEHELILSAIENHDFDKAKVLLKDHLHEVMITHVTIKEKYEEWFDDETVDDF